MIIRRNGCAKNLNFKCDMVASKWPKEALNRLAQSQLLEHKQTNKEAINVTELTQRYSSYHKLREKLLLEGA